MAECRACLATNVRLHLISATRYREMFEKLSGNRLSIEDGRPETVCFLCNVQLEKSWRFFDMAQKSERILSNRLLFGVEMQGSLDSRVHNLSQTAVKSTSFIDGEVLEPEVTVTVKEEIEDDEWEQFKDEFMDSPSGDLDNEDLYAPIQLPASEPKSPNIPMELSISPEISSISPDDLPALDYLSVPSRLSIPSIPTDIQPIDKVPTSEYTFKKVNIKKEVVAKEFDNEEIFDNSVIDRIIVPLKADPKYHPGRSAESFYYCTQCDYRCQHSKTLRRHNRVHDTKNQFECENCLYRFADEKKLASHRNYCTVCNVCGKKFHNLNGLRIHVRLHTGEQPYSCDLCGRGFNQKTNLQTHLRVHAREKQYPCEICHKIFPFSSYLKRHMLLHSENQDGDSLHRSMNCHKLFNRKKKVMSKCTVCGKNLRKDSMSMHMRLHTGELPFSCEKCHRCFNQKCNLLTHVERVHPGDELFACKVCFKTFAINAELRKHLPTHGIKVEIKKELLKQTEKTLENIISRFEIEMEKRTEKKELTEMERKMELILNLGLKPRIIKPGPDINGSFTEHNKGTKRKGGFIVLKQAKRHRIDAITQHLNSSLIIEPDLKKIGAGNFKIFLPSVNDNNMVSNKIVNKLNSLELKQTKAIEDSNVPDTKTTYNSDKVNYKKIDIAVNTNPNHISIENTEDKSNYLNSEQDVFITNSDEIPYFNDFKVKHEIILENNNLSDSRVLLDSVNVDSIEVDRTESDFKTNQTSPKVLNVDIHSPYDVEITENPVSVLHKDKSINPIDSDNFNKKSSIEITKELSSEHNKDFEEDIEYFDDSIEVLEVELSDTEYQNTTEENYNEEFTFATEDLEISSIKHEGSVSKEVTSEDGLAVGSKEVSSEQDAQITSSDCEELKTKEREYTGVEVSVIDPDDVDDSEIDFEEEYLESSDDDIILNENNDDEVMNEESCDETSPDLSTSEIDKNEYSFLDDNNDAISQNEPRIKLRTDLFASNESNISLESNLSLETDLTLKSFTSEDYTLDLDLITDNVDRNLVNEPVICEGELYVNDFEIFQQKNIFSVHRQLNQMLKTPEQAYPCDMCGVVTKVLSY